MRSAEYVVRRAAFALITICAALTLNFFLFRLLPGNAVENFAAIPHASPDIQRSVEHQFGLDRPLWEQYVIYVGQTLHGNLGISFANSQPVMSNLSQKLLNTLPMVGLGLAFAILIGIATGVVAAWRRGTAIDNASSGVALGLYSAPTQWLGLMLLMTFGAFIPSNGMANEFLINPTWYQQLLDTLEHMILPSATFGLNTYGIFTLLVRSSMLETLGEDYVLTARAKGLGAWTVLIRHALRNALLPTTTLIALSIGSMVAGAILIETVFSWPGIGRAIYEAVLNRDYPTLQGAFLIITASVVALNFIADLVYLRLDPRIAQ